MILLVVILEIPTVLQGFDPELGGDENHRSPPSADVAHGQHPWSRTPCVYADTSEYLHEQLVGQRVDRSDNVVDGYESIEVFLALFDPVTGPDTCLMNTDEAAESQYILHRKRRSKLGEEYDHYRNGLGGHPKGSVPVGCQVSRHSGRA